MTDILEKFPKLKNWAQSLGHQIRLFYVFDDLLGKNCIYLTADDKCFAFGANQLGCLGLGHSKYVDEPQLVPELCGRDLTDMYKGYNFMVGLTRDSLVFCWGANECGQLGLGFTSNDKELFKPTINDWLSGKGIAFVSCGLKHALGLTSNGNVFGWGDNGKGQVGCGRDNSIINVPTNLSSISSELVIKSIACGDQHSLALTADNFVFGWGSNEHGQLATGDFLPSHLPKLVYNSKMDILKLICSKNTTYLLTKQGQLFFCGENYLPDHMTRSATLVEIKSDTTLVDVMSCSPLNVCLGRTDGCVYELMKNELSFFETNYKNFDQYFIQKYQLTYETTSLDSTDTEECLIDHLNLFPEHLKKVIVYYYVFDDIDGKNCIYVTKDDNVFAFGSNSRGILGIGDIGSVEEPVLIKELCGKGITKFYIGDGFMLAKSESNEVFCWGNNQLGQLGLGYECAYHKPTKNNYLSALVIEDMACGQSHTLALTRTGDVYGWGGNEWGQVGASSRTKIISVPTRIDIFIKIMAIAAGNHHSMVLTKGKSLISWGKNQCGQLGVAGNSMVIGPGSIVQNDVISIVCNQDNSYILSKNGIVSVHGQTVCDISSRPVFMKLPEVTPDTRLYGNNGTLVASVGHKIYEMRRVAVAVTKRDHFRYDYTLADTEHITCEPIRVIQYAKIRLLGSGSFGTVYQCMSNNSKENFTVKILKTQGLDNEHCGRIYNELVKFCHLNADCLAHVRDIWLENSKIIHLKMDYYEYNLVHFLMEKYLAFQRKRDMPMSLVEFGVTLEIYRQIVAAVDYLHNLDPPICHRNLKSTNIMITGAQGVKNMVRISDFCFTRFCELGAKTRYQSETQYTTIDVMNETKYGLKADIYSLAVIGEDLFEIDVFGNPIRRKCKTILNTSLEAITRMIVSMQLTPKWWLRPDAEDVSRQLRELCPSGSQLMASTGFKNIMDSLKSAKIELFHEIVKSLI